MYEQFKQTLANPATAPASPLGDFPELRNYYGVNFGLGPQEAAAGALINQDQELESERQRSFQKSKQDIASRLKEINRMFDPNEYKKVLKEDGGFDYFAPDGTQINLRKYSLATGKQPRDILKDSDNNLDRQYLRDHEDLQKTLEAISSKDGAYFEKLKKDYPDRYDAIKGMTPADLVNRFRQAYPNVYADEGRGEYRNEPLGSVPMPQEKKKKGNLIDQAGSLFNFLKSTLLGD